MLHTESHHMQAGRVPAVFEFVRCGVMSDIDCSPHFEYIWFGESTGTYDTGDTIDTVTNESDT